MDNNEIILPENLIDLDHGLLSSYLVRVGYRLTELLSLLPEAKANEKNCKMSHKILRAEAVIKSLHIDELKTESLRKAYSECAVEVKQAKDDYIKAVETYSRTESLIKKYENLYTTCSRVITLKDQKLREETLSGKVSP